jgi:hypothetical protein
MVAPPRLADKAVKSPAKFLVILMVMAVVSAITYWRMHHQSDLKAATAPATVVDTPSPALAAAFPPPTMPPISPTQTVAITPDSIATLSDGGPGAAQRIFATDPALKKLDDDMYHCTRMMHMQGITAQQLVDKLAELGQGQANTQMVQEQMDNCAPFVAGGWIKQWFDVVFRAERGDQLAGDYLLLGMRSGFSNNFLKLLPEQAQDRIVSATEIAMKSAIERGDRFWIQHAASDYMNRRLPQNPEKSYHAVALCLELGLCLEDMRRIYTHHLPPDVLARLDAQAKVDAARIRPNVRPSQIPMRP